MIEENIDTWTIPTMTGRFAYWRIRLTKRQSKVKDPPDSYRDQNRMGCYDPSGIKLL